MHFILNIIAHSIIGWRNNPIIWFHRWLSNAMHSTTFWAISVQLCSMINIAALILKAINDNVLVSLLHIVMTIFSTNNLLIYVDIISIIFTLNRISRNSTIWSLPISSSWRLWCIFWRRLRYISLWLWRNVGRCRLNNDMALVVVINHFLIVFILLNSNLLPNLHFISRLKILNLHLLIL